MMIELGVGPTVAGSASIGTSNAEPEYTSAKIAKRAMNILPSCAEGPTVTGIG